VPTDGVILNVVNADKTLKFHVTVTGIDGAAHQACAERSSTLMGQVFNRKSAIAYAKSRGVRWIVGRLNGGGHAQIARALHMVPEAFGVRPVARFEDLVLFQVL
jgi:hypothetical protein